eukprot:416691-Pleurochrysis_carterae.AAC.1
MADEQLTFKPRLSEKTRHIAAQRANRQLMRGDRADRDLWEHHHIEWRRREQEQRALALVYEREESRELTFAPKLTARSARIAEAKGARERGDAPVHQVKLHARSVEGGGFFHRLAFLIAWHRRWDFSFSIAWRSYFSLLDFRDEDG